MLLLDGIDQISKGLYRQSATKCSIWTSLYRKMKNGPWTFKDYPWLKEIHDRRAPLKVARKAAQIGFTEAALNITFYKMDIEKVDCLYLLPTERPLAKDFSTARFDTAIDLSPHLRSMFSDIKNTGYKKAGNISLYIRGANSRSGLKSIPVGFIVFDEYDEMNPDKIPLAMERMSGHKQKEALAISTPMIPGRGVSLLYDQGTQELFNFKCPSCNKYIFLDEPNLVICGDSRNDPRINDSHLKCVECDCILPHEAKSEFLSTGKYIPTNPTADISSFWVNQAYSPTITPVELAKSYFEAQERIEAEQEYYNSKWGKPHTPKGAQVTIEHIDRVRSSYSEVECVNRTPGRIRTMGVDVGKYLHIEIVEWIIEGKLGADLNQQAKAKVILAKKLESFDFLPNYMKTYQVHCAVLDANPERTQVKKFIDKFFGHAYMCFYSNNGSTKDLFQREYQVNVDRTSWMDNALGRFFNQNILLPKDINGEYIDQVQVPVRIITKDINGNPVAKWISKVNDDHYAHSRTYSEIALPLAAAIQTNKDIKNFL